MAERAEAQVERGTPAQWIERLEIFRERFRLGLIDEPKFDEVMRAFQLTDDLGRIWMPGATSNQWYRWDRKRWTAARPPQQLATFKMPIAMAMIWNRSLVAPIAIDIPPDQASAVPVKTNVPPMEPKPAPMAPPSSAPTAPMLTRSTCPHCGESYIPPARFCPNCAQPLTAQAIEKKSRRPTDLPERGATRKPSKPTDLPR